MAVLAVPIVADTVVVVAVALAEEEVYVRTDDY